MERCPVSVTAAAELSDDEVVAAIEELENESIYDESGRLAQPDEVWNYQRGDGVEKAVLLANILGARHPRASMTIEVEPASATLHLDERTYRFTSSKDLRPQTWRPRS